MRSAGVRVTGSPASALVARPSALVAIVAHPLALVLAGAFALRILALVAIPHPLGMDDANFARTAENLHDGYGYVGVRGAVNAVHVSLYPLLVSAALWFGASAVSAGLALSLIAGTLLTVPVYLIARRLFDARVGLVAAAIVAIHPLCVETSTAALADALALTLALGALAALAAGDDVRSAAAAGALFGLAYCTRAEAIGYAAIALVGVAAGARTALARPAAFAIAFLVFAVPYVGVVSHATGHARLDTKSAVNYALASRIAGGMSYDEAANGLGPGGTEAGAELGEGFYQTHPGIADPTIPQRLALAAHVAPLQLARLARIAASRAFGTPLFVLLAAIGCGAAIRRRESRWGSVVLLAVVAFDVAALLTLDHMWLRYTAVFVPFAAIWAAAPLVAAYDALASRASRALRRVALASLVVVVAAGAFGLERAGADPGDPTLAPAAGTWLQREAPGAKLVMEVGDQVAYAARADWMPLPYATSADALAYLRRKRPTFVVLEAARSTSRPYLAAWLAHGIPAREAVYLRTFAPRTPEAIVVYAWRTP